MSIRFVAVVAAATALCLACAGAARSDDPPYLPWVSLLPSVGTPVDPTSTNPCRNGSLSCVDKTIREMQTSFAQLAAECNHNALFSLVYLVVTEQYDQTVDGDPGFFVDTPFVNNEDAVFAGYYFHAYDDWYAGHPALVPSAWQVAFRAADEHEVTGTGDLLLGINAHVNRDLPFVLAELGLFNSDGSSRKPDHDKVNVILNAVERPALTELAHRFDPTIFDPSADPTGLSETTFFQLLEEWREEAWRNAERLVAAAGTPEWESVAQSIEDAAAAKASAIEIETAYRRPLTSTQARDAYCADHAA